MNEFRYILESYKGMQTRYSCPNCHDTRKTFARYINAFTGEYIADDVGRCNREDKCGYHKRPPQSIKCLFVPFKSVKEYSEKAYQLKALNGFYYLPKSKVYEMNEKGCYVSEWHLINSHTNIPFITTDCKYFANGQAVPIPQSTSIVVKGTKQMSLIPIEVFKASLNCYSDNHFVTYLINQFGLEVTNHLIGKYFIGTSKLWDGATVFWQIDATGKVRTGKIMLYDPITGHRVKEPFNHINWAHKALKQFDFALNQCLFGEHLLRDKIKPVALVESEKTAIIASVYLPEFIWLAVGGKQNLNLNTLQALKGRNVVLFPDLNAFEKWAAFAKEHSSFANFVVSDLLDQKASDLEREQGLDLADFLIKFDYKEFNLPDPMENI
jgi:hypothetical protein